MSLGRWRIISGFLTIFTLNWMTQIGATLVTGSTLLLFVLMGLGLSGTIDSAYLGIVTFMILPGFFIVGLLTIPIGAWLNRRRIRKYGAPAAETGQLPVLDFNNPKVRSVAETVAVLTVVNLLIMGVVSYKGVVYTESVEFCGKVCHTVMEPEFTAYSDSPHSRVACVECHIGPGADWFARSKLSGLRQVVAVTLNTYSRPIPTPVKELRPSTETCEECHWPARFTGDRIRVIPKYQEDEVNTLVHTVLLMHIGGGHGAGHGIHSWHIDPSRTTKYLAKDEQRQDIAVVRVKNPDGTETEFRQTGLEMTDEEIEKGEWRTMDCIDCHNRPTHIYYSPAKALDRKMADGAIDVTLPYIKRTAVEALTAATGEAGKAADLEQIAAHVRDFYTKDYPDLAAEKKDAIEAAIGELQSIYQRNVFPEMKVSWGSYPNNLGHEEFPGCFRCHGGDHESKEGTPISNDCELCHATLAWDEEKPEILSQLQLQ